MKITFLGTSSGTPSRTRNVSCIALQLVQQGVLWLFDCGEGTQHQIMQSPLRLSQLEKVFFTHMHGDHLFGIIGLLASRSLQGGGTSPVTLYGPPALEKYVLCTLETSSTGLAYPLHVQPIADSLVYEDDNLQVECRLLKHRINSWGYAVIEKDQPGHFEVEKAMALGIPAGPLYGKLKNGESIILPDGRTIHGADLVGPTRPGRKIVYCSDTIYTPNAVELAANADVLIHEATYLHQDESLAIRGKHSTAAMAARVAQEAKVKTLILTHFSPRYEADARTSMGEMLAEAQTIFPNTFLARDFWSYEVQRN
ncbi:MAG: ribonuclease Z [Chloroflexi bacterium]|nr:ribonuclease Z [Chloroflexota bacterium]